MFGFWESIDTLCKSKETFFPIAKTFQNHDNVKFYVRPMECKLAGTIFKDMPKLGGDKLFYDLCVDFEAGDAKP